MISIGERRGSLFFQAKITIDKIKIQFAPNKNSILRDTKFSDSELFLHFTSDKRRVKITIMTRGID